MKTLFMLLIVILFSVNVFPQNKAIIKTPIKDPKVLSPNKYPVPIPVCRATIVSYAGQTYHTVQIGRQCWLKENLNVGTMIKGSVDQKKINSRILAQGQSSSIEKYCCNDDPANCTTYGGLYQWAEAVQFKNGATNTTSPSPAFTGNIQGICPTGWHIPTEAEFNTLITTVDNDVHKLVAIGKGMDRATNTSGFSALLSGMLHAGNGKTAATTGEFSDERRFTDQGRSENFWSSRAPNKTTAYDFVVREDIDVPREAYVSLGSDKADGCSVRCVQD
jgi:uncharacterized protein (TIGR02145 family)